jgi:uncharacterized protein (DUF2252 family)
VGEKKSPAFGSVLTPDPGSGAPPTKSPTKVVHLSREERAARGKAARTAMPLAAMAELVPAAERDPVALLEEQAATRVPDLVPIRYGRMLTSPFAFYRGGALLMAVDLGASPNSGLKAQLCGDAHLSNFGVFGSPERRLVFDANDFDETLPGPFEWDVKRLAASIEIVGRVNGWRAKERRRAVLAAAAAYRSAMRGFAKKTNLEVWYASLDVEAALAEFGSQLRPERLKMTQAAIAKARTRDSMQAFSKLTTMVDGVPRIKADPPLVVPIEELIDGIAADELYHQIRGLVRSYRRTLQPDRRVLLEQFEMVHMARKVVGVGSVGTRAWILLMQGVDGADPMFLQAKEANASVLERVTGASKFANHGQRVVNGQHLMQASSDIFLGWQRTVGVDGVERDFYLRQLRDWKLSFDPGQMLLEGLSLYAGLCGWTLARAHARSGDRVAIASYLGGKDVFDHAIADFASAYADLNERDFAALSDAASTGRVGVVSGL